MSPPIRILFLTANPSDTAALQLDEEIRLISQRIRRGEYRKLFEIRSAPAIRATDLPYELMDQTPDIVHFSGHGTKSGELCFVSDGDHTTMPIPAQTLARVFRQFRDRVKCVVLNACYSSIQAAAIAESIPCVVGMSRAVPDSTAIAFAAGFYEALAFGKTLAEAFELGQTQVELTAPHLSASADIPQLIARTGEDLRKLRLMRLDQQDESARPSSTATGTQARLSFVLTLEGTAAMSDDFRKRVRAILATIAKDQNLRIKNIRAGSIIIEVEGSEEGYNRILEAIQSTVFQEILGHRIQSIKIVRDANGTGHTAQPQQVSQPVANQGDSIFACAQLRKIISGILVTDSMLDAFALDHFGPVKKQFTNGMERLQKETLLLELADYREIVATLKREYPYEWSRVARRELHSD